MESGFRVGIDVKRILRCAGVTLAFFPAFVSAQHVTALVSVAPIVQTEVSAQADFVATVHPVRRSIVGSAVDGRVVEYLFTGNDISKKVTRVAKGQPLAKLRTTTIEISLASAQAELRIRQQQHAELKNGARRQEKASALAKQRGAMARMEFTRTKYERAKGLFEQRKTVSREQLDLALSNSIEAEQAYREAKAQNDLLIAGARPEQLAQAEGRVVAQQETIRSLEDIFRKHTILAPFDGYVVREHTEVGAWLTKGDPVAEVIQLDVVELEAFVPSRYISPLRIGLEVSVTVEAFPERRFVGLIDRIIPQADVSRTFPVKIRLENPMLENGLLLKSGMLARVGLPVGREEAAVMVPKDAIVLGAGSPRVFVVGPLDPSNRSISVKEVPVELGIAVQGKIQVKGDLHPEELVVVEGNERLRAGQTVRVTSETKQQGS